MKNAAMFALLFIVATVCTAAHAQTLYDGAQGTAPGSQGWSYVSFGGTQTIPMLPTAPYTVYDSTDANSTRGGYTRTSPLPLDRLTGYTLRFDVGVEQESHANNDRAGFSIIAVGSDKRGIELGFWNDRVWAQNDGIATDDGQAGTTIFTHGEEALRNTAALTRYDLLVSGNAYTLKADGAAILSGSLRDYSAFTGTIDPYETPNLLFAGDDTTSANARTRFAFASVSGATVVPEAKTGALVLGVGCLVLGATLWRGGR